jgi:hypothetical protein
MPGGGLIKTIDEAGSFVAINSDGSVLALGTDNNIKFVSLPDGDLLGCAFDLAASPQGAQGVTYQLSNESGQIAEFTIPCGAPIPSGAVCTCNCVAGSYVPTCDCVAYVPAPCSCVGYTVGHYWYPN